MADYVSNGELQPYKELFSEIIDDIRDEVRKNGITFTCDLVGSAKRNLVIRHHNKGFDCDYQIIIQKNKKQKSAEAIKKLFMDFFDRYTPSDFDYCEDSTSAITIKKKNTQRSKIEFSYDIVILQEKASLQIIRRNSDDNYIWNSLPNMRDYVEVLKSIHGNEMWSDLREIYYNKKIDAINGKKGFKDKKSFQLLHEAAKEVLDMYE